MATAEELEARFSCRGTARGGTLIFPPHAAMELIEAAQANGIRVLGVDGFWLSDVGTQPDLEHTLNLSDVRDNGWDQAVTFIVERINSGLQFEVVLEEDGPTAHN